MIHRAHAGDWSPIAQAIQSGVAAVDEEASFGFFFAITCNDDVAFLREEDIERETRGTFLGDYRVRQQQAACRYWPKVSPPTDRTPPKSAVPVLFVSGANDAASPLWFTQRVAPNFSERAEVVVVGHGHTESNDCTLRLWEQLVMTDPCATCAARPAKPCRARPSKRCRSGFSPTPQFPA